MNLKKVLKRLMWMPFGLIKGLVSIANEHARGFENRKKFSESIIVGESTFSDDTTIGKHCRILENCIINHSSVGSYTYIHRNALIQNARIGNFCSISNDVTIGLGAHPLDMFSTSPIFYRVFNTLRYKLVDKDSDFVEFKPIDVGSDVWIGAKVTIMDGVVIGHGAIIATGSIVTKDVPPYAIAVGVPAKILRYRFSEEQRQALLATRWWDREAKDVYSDFDTLMAYVK